MAAPSLTPSLVMLQIRDYHRRHPSARVVERPPDPEELIKEVSLVTHEGIRFNKKFLLLGLFRISEVLSKQILFRESQNFPRILWMKPVLFVKR